MNVKAVMEEIAAKLGVITGLRAFSYPPGRLAPPGAVVGLPEDISFDQTYGRGSDELTLPLWVMVARADARSAFEELAPYLDGSGVKSIKAAADSSKTNVYTACDVVVVMRAVTGTYTYNDVDFIGAEFTVYVTGSGS